MSNVELDIVIPVRRGDPNLETCLDHLQVAIAEVDAGSGTTAHPVTIVCEGASEPTGGWEQSLISQFPGLDLSFVRCDGSVARRRCVGAERGRAALVAFVDSDVHVAPTGLAQLLILAELEPGMAGYAGATPLVGMDSRWGSASEMMPYASAFDFALAGYPLIWAPATLLLVRRSKAGDQPWFRSFAPPRDCSEDVDFGHRVTQLLGRPAIATTGTVVAAHAADWAKGGAALERAWRFGKGDAALLLAHPTDYLPAPMVMPALAGVFLLAIQTRFPWLIVSSAVIAKTASADRWLRSPEYALLIGVHRASEHWHRVRAGKSGRRFIFHEYQALGHIITLGRHAWRDLAALTGCALILGGRKWFHTR